jgi:hypothetical protein
LVTILVPGYQKIYSRAVTVSVPGSRNSCRRAGRAGEHRRRRALENSIHLEGQP